jgi:hypothetical protein
LFLAINRLGHVAKRFAVNQPMALVLLGKTLDQVYLMLEILRSRLFVIPMYNTRDLLATMYTQ